MEADRPSFYSQCTPYLQFVCKMRKIMVPISFIKCEYMCHFAVHGTEELNTCWLRRKVCSLYNWGQGRAKL